MTGVNDAPSKATSSKATKARMVGGSSKTTKGESKRYCDRGYDVMIAVYASSRRESAYFIEKYLHQVFKIGLNGIECSLMKEGARAQEISLLWYI